MYLIKSMYLVRERTHAPSFFDPLINNLIFYQNRFDRNQYFYEVKIFITIEVRIEPSTCLFVTMRLSFYLMLYCRAKRAF